MTTPLPREIIPWTDEDEAAADRAWARLAAGKGADGYWGTTPPQRATLTDPTLPQYIFVGPDVHNHWHGAKGRFEAGHALEHVSSQGGHLHVEQATTGKGFHVGHVDVLGTLHEIGRNLTLTRANELAKAHGVPGRLKLADFPARIQRTATGPAKGKPAAAIQPTLHQPVHQPSPTELKAAAEARVAQAQTALRKAGRTLTAAEKARDQARETNTAEIDRVSNLRHEAYLADFHGYGNARVAIEEQRARAAGEAGKKPAVYAKMLAAEQPLREAQVAYDAAKATHDAAEKLATELVDRYRAQYGQHDMGWVDRMRRDHPDYKAAFNAQWKASSAKDKAQRALWRVQGQYEGARKSLAGKVSEADIEAHPLRSNTKARLAELDAQLGHLTGETALRAAFQAHEEAKAALQGAQFALKFPAWKYTLRVVPIQPATYTSLDQWPVKTLAAARKADMTGGVDRHTGDMALSELQHAQGFDGKPDVVTDAEMAQYVKAGETELFRGDTKPGHTDNMLQGDYHAGLGIRGNGTYAQDAQVAGRSTARSYAKDHGNDGLIIHMTLKQGARVITYSDLQHRASAAAKAARTAIETATASGDRAALAHAKTLEWLATSDTSRFAVALGYDAVHIPAHGQWIILNRTALRISHQVEG